MLTPELISQFRYKLRFRRKLSQEEKVKIVKPPPKPQMKETIVIDDITKSQQDPKNYRGLILTNGLKVTLISDPSTSKSAACLAFEVGKMNDPDDIEGLAHLCEHAMFLGSEKFPADNDFRLFISEHGGFTNAQTFSDVTKYFFDIVPEKLDDALERFSQMFLAPLFDGEAIAREIQAVDNEHEMNLSSDTWRVRMVNKRLALKDHPYNKFGTGNRKTLTKYGIDIRKELIDFHQKYYNSGNLMNLCVMGREPLDKLEDIVKKYFLVESIVDGKSELPVYSDQVYAEEEMMTKLYIIPLHDVRTMTMSFQTTCLLGYFKSKPQQYIVNLIANESKGSIISELRRRRWSTSLNCDHVKYANGFGFFEVKVDLTDEGFSHMDDIVQLVFQYLKLIRISGIQEWIYEEQSRLSEIEFAFEDERNAIGIVSKVASCMRHYPMKEILSGGVLMEEFDPQLIKFVLDMLTPENMRIIIVDQNFYYRCNLTEEIYGTKYGYGKIAQSRINVWKLCGLDENLKLPEKNLFIPENFDFHPIENWKQTHPKIIRDSSITRVWFKQDTEYRKPKTILTIELKNATVNCDPLNWNLTQIFAWMLEDQLKERLYSAVIAGTDWNFSVSTAGIRIFIDGYSEKMEIFVETILNEIYKFKIDLQKFEDAFDEYYADLKGFEGERAQQIGIYYLELLLNEQMWSNEELIAAMKVISLCRMKTFVKEVLTLAYGECFIFGNVDEEKALKLAAIVENRLNKARSSNKLIILTTNIARERKLENSSHWTLEMLTEYDKINSINLFVHCGLQDDKSNVLLDLVHQILRAEFFDALRTKEQQGYVVDCILRRSNGTQGIKFVVETTKKPEYIEGRIVRFMMTMRNFLAQMSKEKFDTHKKSLRTKKLQTPLTLTHQFWRYHHEIANQTYHFNRHQVEATILRSLKQEELVEFYESHIATTDSVSTKESSLLSIHIVMPKSASNSKPANSIENLMEFRAELQLNPRPTRFKSLRKFYSKKM